MENKYYQRNKLANVLGISKETLRYYEDKHIIEPKRDPSNGYRAYDGYDCQTLIYLRMLRAYDYSLEDATSAKIKASTVAELAELIGASELSASVEAYNASCESGEDAEFGKDAEFLKKIDEASGAVYAIKAAPYCYSTNGALDVNENIEVLDADGNVIPGLYACGTDSIGVFFTEETGYIDYGGVAHGWCFTSGKIAGENAAAYGMQMNEKAEAE